MGEILTQAEMTASRATIPADNCRLDGEDAARFEHLNVGDTVRFDGQAQVIKKEWRYDEKGNKVFCVQLYVNQTFLKTDIESMMEGKVF